MKSRHFITLFIGFFVLSSLFAQTPVVEYKGKIVDRNGNVPLSYCNVLVEGSQQATVTNTDGEFSIKLPAGDESQTLLIRYLGYQNQSVTLKQLRDRGGLIQLSQVIYQLPQIDVMMGDAPTIVRKMFDKVVDNYPQEVMYMTSFYRESIRKNRNYVSLSEAVVDIRKEPYMPYRNDMARLFKARKQTDYSKLDTLVFKLMGGPYNNLYLDVMKHPELVFTDQPFENYFFSFDGVEWMDERLIYVINFNHYPNPEVVLYSGKLYIDAESFALKSAVFDMSFENPGEAVQLLIHKKPMNARVTPLQASYRIDYIEKGGKWYYAYSRIELGMKINWKRKLFNTNYYATIEMAMTNRQNDAADKEIRFRDRLRSDVVISDAAQGFADPDFWGPLNVIEPEKPIEAAIRKILKQLEE